MLGVKSNNRYEKGFCVASSYPQVKNFEFVGINVSPSVEFVSDL